MSPARLVVLGGLPGTGKTTVARRVATALGAAYLRIDAIEQGMRDAGLADAAIGPAGYTAACLLAGENLRLGRDVVADGVNPLPVTRAAWRAAAGGAPVLEVELLCTDPAEHRRRVEARAPDLPGHALPDWAAVAAREMAPWPEPHLVIDTARHTAEEAAALVLAAAAALRG